MNQATLTLPAGTGCYDADGHLHEPLDAYARYMDPKFRENGWRIAAGTGGNERLFRGGRPVRWFFDKAPIPGSFRENLRRFRSGEDVDPFIGEDGPMQPEFQDPDSRLAFLEREGIEASLVFAGIGLADDWAVDASDPAQTYANLRAVNRYLSEEWGWARENRLFTVACMSLVDVDLAVREVEHLIAEGVRLINLVPGPQQGRSPADPYYDPYWVRVNEAEILTTFHTTLASSHAYRQIFNGIWEPPPQQGSFYIGEYVNSAFMGFQSYNERPIMDTVAALILHNLFGRFPELKVLSIENGAFWVPLTVKMMNKNFSLVQEGFWLGGKPDRPSTVFRNHVFVAPFHEESAKAVVDAVGADNVLFGSDFPHAEGLAHPVDDYLDGFDVADPGDVRKIMRENLKSLLRI